jgi:GxxExxY protein
MKSNEVTRAVIGGAIEVHRTMGPGLLESAYEACLEHELPLPVVYHGVRRDCGQRIDLLVEDVVLVELKAV